jgi:hypothetical protein
MRLPMSRSKLRVDILRHLGTPKMPSVDDLAQIEKSYGHQFSAEQAERIIMATGLMTALISGIRDSATVRVVLKKLRKLSAAATSLRGELSAKPISRNTYASLKEIYTEFLNDPKGRAPLPHELMWFLLDVLDLAIATSDFASRQLQKNSDVPDTNFGFLQSEIWNLWVNSITTIMKQHKCPYKVRKDSDKRHGPPSPFVTLIRELQKSLPVEFRRFTQSDDALAQAIHRARQGEDFSNPETSPDLSRLFSALVSTVAKHRKAVR